MSTKKVTKTSKKTKTSGSGPKINATSYVGPIASPRMKTACDSHTFLIGYSGTLASTGAGVLDPVIDPYSQLTSSANWASLQGLFQEYRILGIETHFMPINRFSTATTNFPIFSVVDRGNSTALSSLTTAAAYASVKEHCIGDKIKRTARMSDVDEAGWCLLTTSLPTGSRFYIKLYGSGLAASTNYFQYLSYVLIQCKGIQ